MSTSLDVIFVLPLGLEGAIFPWGIHFLQESLRRSSPAARTRVWDVRSDSFFSELNFAHRRVLSRLFLSLGPEGRGTFFGTTTNPLVFMGLVACAGDRFFDLAGSPRRLRREAGEEVRSLQAEATARIRAQIGAVVEEGNLSPRIWAFSVYDRTLLNSLFIARLIRDQDPEAVIVMGGDAFDFPQAEATVRAVPFIDGIVVGYGEDIMPRIAEDGRTRSSIRSLRLPGLVHDGIVEDVAARAAFRKILSPSSYPGRERPARYSWVTASAPDEIRIMAQRGCSWGKCTFCTQLDRGRVFFPEVGDLISDFDRVLSTLAYRGRSYPVRIIFDSDENALAVIIPFLRHLDASRRPPFRFEVEIWLQVKKFRTELAEALAGLDARRIQVRLILNFESLNERTLIRMRKGHTPLVAAEAAKAILDSGHAFRTNYLSHFPSEERRGVAGEVEWLERLLHLFVPPRGGINLFPYGANDRDEIGRRAGDFGIRTRRLTKDAWLKGLFGLFLPFSQWAFSYREVPGRHIRRWPSFGEYEAFKARAAVFHHFWLARMNWGEIRTGLRDRFRLLGRLMLSAFWTAAVWMLQGRGRGRAFRRRAKLFRFCSRMMAGRPASKKGLPARPVLFIRGRTLVQDIEAPGRRARRTSELSSVELEILRFLYWRRKRGDVVDRFAPALGKGAVDDFLDRHLEWGTLVAWRDDLLCVANDPGFWEGREPRKS